MTSDAQRRYLELVGGWLRESYCELAQQSEQGHPVFLVPGGPHAMRVRVSPIGKDEAVIDVYTWLGRDIQLTPEVARYLLEKNGQLRFGKLSIDPDGDLILEDSLFAEQLDASVVTRLVRLLAAAADEIEDELRTRFG